MPEHKALPRLIRIFLTDSGIFFKLNICFILLGISCKFFSFFQTKKMLSPITITEEFSVLNLAVGLIDLLIVGTFVIAMVCFFMWIHRMNNNLRAVTDERMEYTPGWAVGWFFVPFANLFVPYKVIKEMYLISHKNNPINFSIVKIFWALWILSFAVERAYSQLPANEEFRSTLNELILGTCSHLCDIMVAVCIIRLVPKFIYNPAIRESIF